MSHHYPWNEPVVTAENFPGTIPTSCFWHERYDCPECHPRIAIEAASDEDKARAKPFPAAEGETTP